MWAIAGRAATFGAAVAAAGRGVVVCRGGTDGSGEFREERTTVSRFLRSTRTIKPAVQKLTKEELPPLLPWSGCGERLAREVGDLEACTARVAVSLVACALTYNTSIELASVAAFYWAWAPIIGTALPNILLRVRYRYAGARLPLCSDCHHSILSPNCNLPLSSNDLFIRILLVDLDFTRFCGCPRVREKGDGEVKLEKLTNA